MSVPLDLRTWITDQCLELGDRGAKAARLRVQPVPQGLESATIDRWSWADMGGPHIVAHNIVLALLRIHHRLADKPTVILDFLRADGTAITTRRKTITMGNQQQETQLTGVTAAAIATRKALHGMAGSDSSGGAIPPTASDVHAISHAMALTQSAELVTNLLAHVGDANRQNLETITRMADANVSVMGLQTEQLTKAYTDLGRAQADAEAARHERDELRAELYRLQAGVPEPERNTALFAQLNEVITNARGGITEVTAAYRLKARAKEAEEAAARARSDSSGEGSESGESSEPASLLDSLPPSVRLLMTGLVSGDIPMHMGAQMIMLELDPQWHPLLVSLAAEIVTLAAPDEPPTCDGAS